MLKRFLMRFDAEGKPKFADPIDKAAFRSLLSALRRTLKAQGKDEVFIIGIDNFEKNTSQDQLLLFRVLVALIARESGNDNRTIEETLINDNGGIHPQEMSNSDFQIFIEKCILFSNDFFGMNIQQDANGHFQIIKI